eukprot:jgi/Antlo1/962/1462
MPEKTMRSFRTCVLADAKQKHMEEGVAEGGTMCKIRTASANARALTSLQTQSRIWESSGRTAAI